MSGRTRIAVVDFPEDLTRSIVFVASRCDRFWGETGAVIAGARSLRLRDGDADGLREAAGNAVFGGPATSPATDGWLPGNHGSGGRLRSHFAQLSARAEAS